MVDKPAENLFSTDERESLEALSKRHGYTSLRDYLRALVTQDVSAVSEAYVVESSDADDPIDPIESFRSAWDDAMNGRVISWDEFRRQMLKDAD